MTIKQQGGIFGRNPTFNDVEVDGTLTIGGAAIPAPADTLVSSDIGSTVQAYDADTTKNDVANVFTADQRIQNGVNSAILLGKGAENVDGVVKIKSYQSGADSDQLGIEFGVHPSQFGSGPVEAAVRIDHNKNLVIVTSGAGIDFSATSGTGTSELFDDYERGTFTPFFKTTNDDMGSTGFARIGYYTKIGNVCHVGFYLFSTSLTSAGTGDLIIDGLPFNSAASVQHSLSVSRSSRFGSNPPITAAVTPSDNYIILFSTPHTTASTPTETAASDLNVSGGNQNIIYVAGSYTVA